MKKVFLILPLFYLLSLSGFSQAVTRPDTLVIFGVDFSLAKIVTNNTYNTKNLVKIDIPRLNLEMTKICKLYSSQFHASALAFDTTDVARINAAIDPDKLLTSGSFIFSGGDSSVRQVLKNYNTSRYKNGTGLLLVMEKTDEISDRQSFYMLMFDLKTKKIIHCEKIESKMSKSKNNSGMGWFSWKTVIMKTIRSMEDIYDFWNNYPEREPVDLTKILPLERGVDTAQHIINKKTNTSPGMKNAKIIAFSGTLTQFSNKLETAYTPAFNSDDLNNNKVTGFYAYPKLNGHLEYGISKKISVGVVGAFEKVLIHWRDTLAGAEDNTDTWKRYQVGAKMNYYIVSGARVTLCAGPQIGYNILKSSSTVNANYTSAVQILKVTGQLNVNFAYYIKGVVGISTGIGLGFGSCDIFSLGIAGRF